MNFSELLQRVIDETATVSLGRFSPELVLCGGIVVLLLARLFGCDKWVRSYWIALVGALAAFALAYLQFMHMRTADPSATLQTLAGALGIPGDPGRDTSFFTGLLVYDQFTVFFRLFLLLFLILVIALTVISGLPDNEDGPDFYTLLLGATIGMMLMASANNLLILFLGIEMTSVPSYALVGFLKGRRLSGEAALKYVVYGAGAAGVMLYGTSLLAGMLGTADLSEMSTRLHLLFDGKPGEAIVQVGMGDPTARTIVLGLMLIMVGLAFKLSLVPFHFWCPDAFEGASAEVAGFLSVASKAAAFALLVRVCLAFVGNGAGALADIGLHIGIGLGVMAAVSATFGNLAAYAQTNVKRLLAYSTIAHAGYMLMAVAALMILKNGAAPEGMTAAEFAESQRRCIEGLLYYLAVYLFMNLGAFAIVAIIRNKIYSEEIDDYAGLITQTPVLCVCMLLCLFSLIGLPPLGGFFAKWIIFSSLFQAGKIHWSMWAVLVVAGANTVFSLFYYLRVLKAMIFEPRPEGARSAKIPARSEAAVYVLLVSIPVLLFGVFPPLMQGLTQTANEVAEMLLAGSIPR
ncbi:MAG: NADH-quinone oxidoreductase subunit N [Planctomycetaceae bacterium]